MRRSSDVPLFHGTKQQLWLRGRVSGRPEQHFISFPPFLLLFFLGLTLVGLVPAVSRHQSEAARPEQTRGEGGQQCTSSLPRQQHVLQNRAPASEPCSSKLGLRCSSRGFLKGAAETYLLSNFEFVLLAFFLDLHEPNENARSICRF